MRPQRLTAKSNEYSPFRFVFKSETIFHTEDNKNGKRKKIADH